MTFIAALSGGAYWGFKNYPRLLFKFKKDKYTAIMQMMESYEKSAQAQKTTPENKSSDISPIEDLLDRLIRDNPSDGYLYYLFGRLYATECVEPIIQDNQKFTDVLFLDYIQKHHIPEGVSVNHWEKGISYTRKALLLGLPESEKEKAVVNLLKLYFIGGTPFWSSAVDYLRPEDINKSELTYNIYKLVFTETVPNWEQFTKIYGEETNVFLMGLYFLKLRNYPLAFFYFKKLLLSDSIYLRNNAYYIMGYIMGEQKDMALKAYYHSLIDFDEFLKRNPWFLEEHNYTLRYTGQESMAKSFLGQYEKMVLELRDSQ